MMASRDRPLKTSSPFAAFLERGTLRRMAGARAFERGEDYFLNGQVGALAEHERTITAKVQGTQPYRTLAEAEWAKVPVLGPGRDDPEKYGKRFRITHMMETLARQTGDVEKILAVKKRDLSLAYHYLQIAETYKNARKHDLALEWAERGVKAFPERTDSRLREFLAGNITAANATMMRWR